MIRQATLGDIDRVAELYIEGLDELGSKNIDPAKVEQKVRISFNLAPCFCLVKDGIIIGIAGLTLITSSWSGDASLADYMFYVEPQHRNIKRLSALVNKSKEFADLHNLPLRLEFATNVSAEVRTRLFKMHGFKVASVMGEYHNG